MDGNVCYLKNSWNYLFISEKRKIRSQKIIHFAGIRPWLSIQHPHSDLWWEIADKTFFLQDLKNELYHSADRIEYLENIEKLYSSMRRSTCWRLTWFLRVIFDMVKKIRNLLKRN